MRIYAFYVLKMEKIAENIEIRNITPSRRQKKIDN